MPKKCIKFIPEYLIPNLNNKTFGKHLKWIDKSKNIFEIYWHHKSGPEWTEQEAQVFVEWDKHKGHFKPGNKQYYTQSKQRFRALLYKLTQEGQLKELPAETKFKKVYCIGTIKNGRKKTDPDVDAELESSNEEETSLEEEEYRATDDMYCRKVSEVDAVNVREDHSYSIFRNFQNSFIDGPIYDSENGQMILSNIQDICVPTSTSEPLLENFQKRILVERNCDNITTLLPAAIPNFCAENFSSFEDLSDWSENTVSVLAGKLCMDPYFLTYQSTLTSATILDSVSSMQANLDFLESLDTSCFLNSDI